MPKAPIDAPDDPTQDDPKEVAALERMRAKLERLNRDADLLRDALRKKSKDG